MAFGKLNAETLLICSHFALNANNLGLSYWYDLRSNDPKRANRDKSPQRDLGWHHRLAWQRGHVFRGFIRDVFQPKGQLPRYLGQ